eukprot:6071217-Pleurochrysis_carterae.AAC.1
MVCEMSKRSTQRWMPRNPRWQHHQQLRQQQRTANWQTGFPAHEAPHKAYQDLAVRAGEAG